MTRGTTRAAARRARPSHPRAARARQDVGQSSSKKPAGARCAGSEKDRGGEADARVGSPSRWLLQPRRVQRRYLPGLRQGWQRLLCGQ